MITLRIVLLAFLIFCAVVVSLSKDLLRSIILFMAYSLAMALVWLLLESPDLAITEAAVGAGITGILLFGTLRKINAIGDTGERDGE